MTELTKQLEEAQHIDFLGIGGIGMSALARYYRLKNKKITGYDKVRTELTKKMEAEGIEIRYNTLTTGTEHLADLVIYTPAIPDDFTDKVYYINKGFTPFKRAEVLGAISKQKRLIAIAGTHGKTSTSSLVSYILKEAKIDVTAFVGGIMKAYDTNFIYGKSDWVVAEADEFDRSFLHLFPEILILQSLDPDHLDIYRDKEDLTRTYVQLISQLRKGGVLITNLEVYAQLKEHIDSLNSKVLIYGEENADFAISIEEQNHQGATWMIRHENDEQNYQLPFGGLYNIMNATSAIMVADLLELKAQNVADILSRYPGVGRRMEIVIPHGDCVLIDDYAHHPTEIRASINAVKSMYPERRITGIFQPHLYSRTRDFLDGFVDSLEELDDIILTPIYPAREEPIEGISTRLIYDKINKSSKYLRPKEEVLDVLDELENIELLLVLGAGDISTIVQTLKENIERGKKD